MGSPCTYHHHASSPSVDPRTECKKQWLQGKGSSWDEGCGKSWSYESRALLEEGTVRGWEQRLKVGWGMEKGKSRETDKRSQTNRNKNQKIGTERELHKRPIKWSVGKLYETLGPAVYTATLKRKWPQSILSHLLAIMGWIVSPKKICWSPNPQHLGTWPYSETGSL